MNVQIDVEQARFNMVEQQIRTWEVLDQQVLDLLFAMRREEFVPPQYRSLAFVDMEIPLGQGEKMLAPKLEARTLQELAVKPTDRILEIGTGSGYMTALLAKRGAHVYSVEIIPEFSSQAATRLAAHGISNVTLEIGDGARGWSMGLYDVILLTGSVPVLVDEFQRSLNSGGRLLAVVGEAPVMEARLITCVAGGACNAFGLFETCIPALRNAPQPEKFRILIEQLPAAVLKQWLDDKSRNAPLILDVREPWEYGICRIPSALSFPMQDIAARWGELPRETDIVVVCHHGMRSLQVANYLAQAGFDHVYNLSGGVSAWAEQVDPAMPRY